MPQPITHSITGFDADPTPDARFGHGFADIIDQYDWQQTTLDIDRTTPDDVSRVLNKARAATKPLTTDDLMALLSPAAEPFLEEMAQLAHRFTQERFGNTISLYIPMYVSNACSNACVYCGFNHHNKFERTVLTPDEIDAECQAIKRLAPFDNILIVSGEMPSVCGTPYFEQAIAVAKKHFHNISLEVQPLKQSDYQRLLAAGLNGVVCFQETYNRANYKNYHPAGMKSFFDWRLNGYDRMGAAGLYKIGMGVLIGLEDWRTDLTFMARHLRYLQKRYWRSRFSVNFPRMCPSESGYQPNVVMSDRQLVQATCAFRIFDHDIDISYSTRELPHLRDNMLGLGVTSVSAGSKTDPGGYAVYPRSLEQFHVSDERTPAQVADAIRAHGFDPVWKDWDQILI